MLRICGITYDHTVNYGSLFQAFALQRAIENSELSDGTTCTYQLIPVRICEDWPIHRTFARRIASIFIKRFRKKFAGFEDERMHYAAVKRISDCSTLNETEDAFVCGSDVIWNPDLNLKVDAFYLNFTEKYKFSYAASFGKANVSDETLKRVKAYLSSFQAISVREKSGMDTIQRSINNPVQTVCDPVFLLEKNEWESVMETKGKEVGYIFVYITHLSQSVQTFIDALKAKTGLRIVYSAYGPKQALKQGMLQIQTPEKWLQLLHDAEYVVTNSFHATAFSTMFHKKFFTVVNGQKDGGINIRMYDFLKSMGLEDRLYNSVPDNIDTSEIDFTYADAELARQREFSLKFLRDNLEAANQEKLKLEGKV